MGDTVLPLLWFPLQVVRVLDAFDWGCPLSFLERIVSRFDRLVDPACCRERDFNERFIRRQIDDWLSGVARYRYPLPINLVADGVGGRGCRYRLPMFACYTPR